MKTIRHLAVTTVALLAGPALTSAEQVKPAPVNPYNGMQEREEVFEFTEKPAVKKKDLANRPTAQVQERLQSVP